jgi:hypothetical protein
MKKLRMDLDQIRVERFETLPGEAENGTVLGNNLFLTKTADCGSCFVDSCVTGSQRPCPACP